MKPAPFELHEPISVDAAVALLAQYGDDAKVLAGGQSLTPMLSLRLTRFDHLVDLGRVDALRGITIDAGFVHIGAMTPQAVVERDPRLTSALPLVARAVPWIGHRAVRNRGTFGGSLAHSDPASELPAVALALDARFTCRSIRGEREVPAAEFFLGTWTTALADDEILTSVSFPVARPGQGFAIEEVARRHGDFALAGAVCALTVRNDLVSHAAVALFGMAPSAVRATAAESLLVGASVATLELEAIGRAAVEESSPTDDIHATAEYRRTVGAHLVGRAIVNAVDDARA